MLRPLVFTKRWQTFCCIFIPMSYVKVKPHFLSICFVCDLSPSLSLSLSVSLFLCFSVFVFISLRLLKNKRELKRIKAPFVREPARNFFKEGGGDEGFLPEETSSEPSE